MRLRLFALIAFAVLVPASAARAASFAVNSTADTVSTVAPNGVCDADNDSGNGLQCTLREAVKEGSAATDPSNSIAVPAGTYTLSAAMGTGLAVDNTHPLTITGEGARSTVIDAARNSRVLYANTTALLTLSGLTFTHGDASAEDASSGGGLFLDGLVAIDHSAIVDNRTGGSSADGGGISTNDKLTLTDSTVSGNVATGNGGGIFNSSRLAITNSTISGNSASVGRGGGVFDNPSGTDSLLEQKLLNVTITDNTASFAGGFDLDNTNPAPIENSIIANNAASPAPAPLHTQAVVATPSNCGVSYRPETNTIDSLGHNVENADTCQFRAAGDKHDVAVPMGALRDNGGPTDTELPQSGNPAIDNGNDASCPAADQRGVTRPQDAHCDTGAVEVANASLHHPHPPPKRCVDHIRPVSRPSRKESSVSRTGIDARGTSSDKGCTTNPATPVDRGGVGRVLISITRQTRGRCQVLHADGTFGARQGCHRARLYAFEATGTTKWHFVLHRSLPHGLYRIFAKAVDLRGNTERFDRRQRNGIKLPLR